MSAQEYIFSIRLEDGSQAEARTTDSASMAKLRKLMSDPKWARRPVRVASAPGDVSGHLSGDTVAVSLLIDDDDVEGHTMTLRFPSAQEAKRLQQRLIVGGVLAATLAVGAVGGAQLVNQQAQAAPQAGPAITVPATRLAPERGAPMTQAKDAKDAKDAARLSGTGAADEVSNESLGQRSVMPK